MNRLEHAVNHCFKSMRRRSGKPDTGYVYVLRCGDYVKVGIASNVTARVSSLQTGNPHPVELLMHWPSETPERDERILHRSLENYHHRGEWFHASAQVFNILAGVSNNP